MKMFVSNLNQNQKLNRTQYISERQRLVSKTVMPPSQRSRSKRIIKPVIRLTYDELGKCSDHPIEIVHRGVIIKLGQS